MQGKANVIISGTPNETTIHVQNLIEAAGNRFVVHRNRKDVLAFFLQLSRDSEDFNSAGGIRKLRQFLELFIDFRCYNNPHKTLDSLSLETELFNAKRRLEEGME